ncbi:MAG: MATE family efflux transporter [Thermoanaerobacteraceae bacterium]|nr:MATE family efflux transporter [Thermoanaerobacteraceae bacterium]
MSCDKKPALEKNTMDFTQGSIPKHLLNFAIPLFIGNILQAFYNTVDSIWVGKYLGPDALAAVSVCSPIVFVMIAMVTGLSMATTVMIAQYKGAQNSEMVKKTVGNTMYILAIAAIIMTIIGICFRRPILRLIGTPSESMDMASGYLFITSAGLVFVFGYNAVSAILRGFGDSRTPLLFLFYSTVINIVLDPVFIFGLGPIPKMGVDGAALATIMAQAIAFLLAVRYLNKTNELLAIRINEVKCDPSVTKQLLKIGIPAGLQQTVVAMGHTVIMSVITSFGTSVVAAYGAANKIDSFFFLPSMSIGLATSSLAGQNLGAGKYERVYETMKRGSILSISISTVMILIIYLIPEHLLLLFTDETEVIEEGIIILKTLAMAYIPFGIMWVANGIIRGAGDTVVAMILSILSLWILRIPLAVIFSKHMGSRGIWTGIAISMAISGAMSYLYYRAGRWKRCVFASREASINL